MRMTSRGRPITLSDEIGDIISDNLPTDYPIDKFIGSTAWKDMLHEIVETMNEHLKEALK